MPTTLLPRDVALIAEPLEAAGVVEMHRSAPDATAREVGFAVSMFPDAAAIMTTGADVLALNRVLSVGLEAPFGDTRLAVLIDWYRRAGVPRFFVQPSPATRPAGVADRLISARLTHYNNWVRLYRDTRPVPAPAPGAALGVHVIAPERSAMFADIVTTAFGMPDALRPWMAASVGRPGWRHYLAFSEGRAIATAALLVRHDVGWLSLASTAAEARGRGAQSALIARRIDDARQAGCRWLVTETAEDTPARPAPSARNLQRLGFRVAYLRPNFIWTGAG